MFNSLRPRPRSHHQALVLNGAKQVLLIEAGTRRSVLTLPGGAAGRREPPHLAARRHLEASTGLVRALHCLLIVDFVGARPFQFVHWGGQLDPDQAAEVARRSSLHWVDEDSLPEVVAPDDLRRISHALAFLAWQAMLPALVHGMRP
ncbi:NUDIX domain-containing protein [Kitasatospora sp. NPDC048296]|uniref:NUDIX domain-containing protein n=1 Tax=Kitasatospora sp. NPDC048296 TaxID=3364048 RepID=UPI00371973FB